MGLSKDKVQQRVTQALSLVGMAGYEPRSSHHLSRGEKKRIAIATVLSMNPEVLVIDEPTSDLDPRSKWSLVALLKGLPMTQIITTHDLEILKSLCERTVVLDQGKIVADGPTGEILADAALLEAHGLASPRQA
jgi:cobalt/nickel transport system ATP-binding protein